MGNANSIMHNLFRNEAIIAKQYNYGKPIKPIGVSMRLAGVFFTVLIIGITLFLTAVDFSRKESASGSLTSTSGTLKIIPNKTGVVTQVFVNDGDYVKAGEPLIEISADSVTSKGTNVSAESLKYAENQLRILDRERVANEKLKNERLQSEKSKILNSKNQLLELQKSIQLQLLQIANLNKSLENYGILKKEQLISEVQFRDHEAKLLSAQQTLISLKREFYNLESQIELSRNEIAKINTQSVIESISTDVSSLQILDKRLAAEAEKAQVLTAKTTGRITSIRAKIGEPVQVGAAVAVIVPKNAILQAEIWVSSAAVPYLKIGTPVNIMYDAFPYQKFGLAKGLVSEIAQSPTPPDELPLDLESRESRYRVIVKLDSQKMMAYGVATHLTPGMRLKSDLILDKRSLLEWFLEPVFSSKSRL